MITPTIGRVVWYYKPGMEHTDQALAALVALVNDDGSINVGGFESNGVPFSDHNVLLVQDGYGNPGGGSWATWMPYQKGQAAKTEDGVVERLAALEKHVVESVGTRLAEITENLESLLTK